MTMKLYIAVVAFLASLTLAACSDPQHYSRTGKGALIGGAVGADAGALVGSAYGAPIEGAVVGAGAGALGGAAIGETWRNGIGDGRFSITPTPTTTQAIGIAMKTSTRTRKRTKTRGNTGIGGNMEDGGTTSMKKTTTKSHGPAVGPSTVLLRRCAVVSLAV